ncbi:MAG: N-acetyl-alpha-D-glucosaminyl L-malate synthase BshA [Verrucomicrobia bacterium]|nr:N-acetyl-alpha-D-glucosaminyl L-malate synthase BshA [Verrucomicrobiota bacterium]
MPPERPLKIGITCYPSVGGSGILATSLGLELAARGHEIHFVSYERPFRLPANTPRLFFHRVEINSYGLFKYPDYTLPLSVKLAETSRDFGLDIIHAHYAVPHATAALLARDMLPAHRRPKVITTLHGTDTTLLGRDPGYGPAIRHALEAADGITAVSEFLRAETEKLIAVNRPIEVIYNFFTPQPPSRSRADVRRELGVDDHEVLLFHSSNLRPVKRFDILLEAFARVQSRAPCKLLVLAGGDFSAFSEEIARLGIRERIIVRENITAIEDYLQAADLGFFTSESESFCLGILEAMAFGFPSVSTRVGGIPEVTLHGETGLLAQAGDVAGLVDALVTLITDPVARARMGAAARVRAQTTFTAPVIVEHYLRYYRAVCAADSFHDGAGM